MDIKKIFQAANPLSLRDRESATPTEKAIKADSATDRDANGQMPGKEDHSQQEPPTEEEFQEALEHLKKMESVTRNGWSVQADVQNEKKFILILDQSGKVIRRIPELELKSLLQFQKSQKDQKGQLIRRTA
jgi:uncharacterized FlaG/YvyC family protein